MKKGYVEILGVTVVKTRILGMALRNAENKGVRKGVRKGTRKGILAGAAVAAVATIAAKRQTDNNRIERLYAEDKGTSNIEG